MSGRAWHEEMAERVEQELATVESILLSLIDESGEVAEEHYDLHDQTYKVQKALRAAVDRLQEVSA